MIRELDMNGQWQMVDSSNIEAIAFNWEYIDKGTLHVKFRSNGKHYAYSDVPTAVYQNLMNAESIGKAFYATVVNKYNFAIIE